VPSIILPKSIFIHVPKTGGTTVQKTLRTYICDALYTEGHLTVDELAQQGHQRNKSLAFVRHPLTWYRSFWAFKMWGKEKYKRAEDAPMKVWTFAEFPPAMEFNDFLAGVFEQYPGGFLTSFYKHFLKGVSYVGKYENLSADLVNFLFSAGEHFDINQITSAFSEYRKNETPKRFLDSAKLTDEIVEMVFKYELEVITQLDYNYIP